MNKQMIAVIFLVLSSIACGMQAQTPSYNGLTPSSDVSLPVKAAAIVEPTESAPVYMTTGALNVRAEPNADSTILGTLAPLTVIQIYVIDQLGDDCFGGEWYAISSPIEGYVCSLWVVRK